MDSSNTSNTVEGKSRRTVLKSLGVGTSSLYIGSGVTGAVETDSSETAELVEVGMCGMFEVSDNEFPPEHDVDRFTPYSINQKDGYVAADEDITEALLDGKPKVSTQGVGSELFQSLTRPISPSGPSRMITTRLSGGAPIKGVPLEQSREFGKAHLSEESDGAVGVRYRGSTATIEPGSVKIIDGTPADVPVGRNDEQTEVTVRPNLRVANYREFDVRVKGVK